MDFQGIRIENLVLGPSCCGAVGQVAVEMQAEVVAVARIQPLVRNPMCCGYNHKKKKKKEKKILFLFH